MAASQPIPSWAKFCDTGVTELDTSARAITDGQRLIAAALGELGREVRGVLSDAGIRSDVIKGELLARIAKKVEESAITCLNANTEIEAQVNRILDAAQDAANEGIESLGLPTPKEPPAPVQPISERTGPGALDVAAPENAALLAQQQPPKVALSASAEEAPLPPPAPIGATAKGLIPPTESLCELGMTVQDLSWKASYFGLRAEKKDEADALAFLGPVARAIIAAGGPMGLPAGPQAQWESQQ